MTTASADTAPPAGPAKCRVQDKTDAPADVWIEADRESWITVVAADCDADPACFAAVDDNLLRNPNVVSPHLFRAEIAYDSDADSGLIFDSSAYPGLSPADCAAEARGASFVDHMSVGKTPRPVGGSVGSGRWRRTVVRTLVPRNPNRDRPIEQTCHFYSCQTAGRDDNDNDNDNDDDDDDDMLVIQIPHVSRADDVPFYHPAVAAVAFRYCFNRRRDKTGRLSVTFRLFPTAAPTELPDRLRRTATRLLGTVHRHMNGHQTGYEKRVHHDQIVSQARLQDTYTDLKVRHARQLIADWKESTDPAKHVFEDLAIAAFLIELWRQMYPAGGDQRFPGFVDIGCGNGLLVDILNRSGFPGWGFDVRARKSWGSQTGKTLHEKILIPAVFPDSDQARILDPTTPSTIDARPGGDEPTPSPLSHNGLFRPGVFIVSNHADELTVWTPLLAFLSDCPFIAIPCCSHAFDGSKFRARERLRQPPPPSPQSPLLSQATPSTRAATSNPERGSLKAKAGQPSAYSALCSYVTALAASVGFEPEQEVLRIPSTRNTAIIGRTRRSQSDVASPSDLSRAEKINLLVRLIESEMESDIRTVQDTWKRATDRLTKLKSSSISSDLHAV